MGNLTDVPDSDILDFVPPLERKSHAYTIFELIITYKLLQSSRVDKPVQSWIKSPNVSIWNWWRKGSQDCVGMLPLEWIQIDFVPDQQLSPDPVNLEIMSGFYSRFPATNIPCVNESATRTFSWLFTLFLDIRKLQKIPTLDLCLYPYNKLPFLPCGSLVPHGIGQGRRAENRAATTWNVIRRLCFLCDTKRELRDPSFLPPWSISLRFNRCEVLIGHQTSTARSERLSWHDL